MLRTPSRIVLGLILLATISIGAIQIHKWQSFGYNGLDLAIYTNTVHNLAHGRGFASSIHHPSYLGDHLELGLIPIAGIYRIIPSGLTLLLLQTLLITASAWLVWLVVRPLLGPRVGVLAAGLWLANPFVWNVALYEFHGLVFAWPILWWSILAYRQRAIRQWWLALGLLCLVREDMPLVALGWAGLAALDRRGWRWWLPAAVGGLGWFIAAQGIISAINPDQAYKYLVFYRWAGNTPLEILTVPFRQPLVFLGHVFQPGNVQTTLGLLIGMGGLAIWRWRLVLPVAPVFAQLMMLGAQPESVLRIHYVIPYLPFLAWATVMVVHGIREGRQWLRIDPQLRLSLATILVIVGPLYAHGLFGPAQMPWSTRTDVGNSPRAILRAAVAEVTPTDRVLTTFNLLPNLAERESIYSLNYLYLGRRQYTEQPYTLPTDVDVAVIDWQQLYQYQYIYRTTLYEGRSGAERIRDFLLDQNLDLVWWKDSVAVYRRGGADEFQATRRMTIGKISGPTYGPLTLLNTPLALTVGRESITGETYSVIPVELQWLRREASDGVISIRFTATQNSKVVWTSTRLIGQGFYPAVDWPIGSAWTTRYLLNVPSAISQKISLQAEILRLEGRYRLNPVRGFSPVVTTQDNLGTIDLGHITLP